MIIRRYRPEDRPSIERICLDTGLRGRLFEIFRDTDIFLDMWLSPYLDYEPEGALVAEDDGHVFGYLVGSFSPRFAWNAGRIMLRNAARMASRMLAGRYADHPPSERFVRWFLYDAIHDIPARPPRSSHLHFNLEARYRDHHFRTGPAGQLLRRYEQMVYDHGLRSYYGTVFTTPTRRRLRLYRHGGFEIYDSTRFTLFHDDEVYLTAIVKYYDEERGEWPQYSRS